MKTIQGSNPKCNVPKYGSLEMSNFYICDAFCCHMIFGDPKFGRLHLGLPPCIALIHYTWLILVINCNNEVYPTCSTMLSRGHSGKRKFSQVNDTSRWEWFTIFEIDYLLCYTFCSDKLGIYVLQTSELIRKETPSFSSRSKNGKFFHKTHDNVCSNWTRQKYKSSKLSLNNNFHWLNWTKDLYKMTSTHNALNICLLYDCIVSAVCCSSTKSKLSNHLNMFLNVGRQNRVIEFSLNDFHWIQSSYSH